MKEKRPLLAAVASVDITPDTDVYLEGYHDNCQLTLAHCPEDFVSDLRARILILKSGADALVLVNLELLFADAGIQYETLSPDFYARAAALCDTLPENVILSNTHTHHAPRQLGKAQEEALYRAIGEAYRSLQPATLRLGYGHTAYGVSRYNDYTVDYTRPYDDIVTVLGIDRADGTPMGLVFNVPIHNTMFGHGPGLNPNRHRMCCEFTGYACRHMEQTENIIAMHVNGFYGNSGPVYKGRFYAESLEELKQAGGELGNEILGIWEKAETAELAGEVHSLFRHESLPARKDREGIHWRFGEFEREPMVIHAASFGALAVLTVNYEPFSMLGARLRAESPFPVTLPAGGMGWRGYIPTRQTWNAHAKQHEVECAPLKTPLTPEGCEEAYEKMLEALCDLQNVTLRRTELAFTGVAEEDGCAVYSFCLPEGLTPDKLVVDFGQYTRPDCASEFTVTAGEQILAQVQDFSSGYLGIPAPQQPVGKICLTVYRRYLHGKLGISRLTPRLWAICYDRKEEM